MTRGQQVLSVRAVIFDLDDTLVPDDASVMDALVATCRVAQREYGIDAGALRSSIVTHARSLWHASPTHPYCRDVGISSWEGLWGDFSGCGAGLQALRAWAPAYRRSAWFHALAECGVSDSALVERLAATFVRERRGRHGAYPDAAPALLRLQGQCLLALLTNGAPDLQREKLESAGLSRFFDVVVVSGDVGIGKPDSRIFATTLKMLRVGPQEAAMVGDSLARDVVGAQRAGIKAVWLNRVGQTQSIDSVTPHVEIGTLVDLPAVLQTPG